MLKRLTIVIIAILLSTIIAYAQLQQPSPSPGESSHPIQNHTTGKQQPSETDKRGTEQSPFVVKTINPPKTQNEAEKERKEQEEKAANDRWLVYFTGALVVVAILQFGALILQAHYLNKSFGSAEKAADAAKKSADALPAIERAYLFVKVTMKTPDAEGIAGTIDAGPQYNPGNVKLIITNHGKTPAILTGYPFTTKVLNAIEIADYISDCLSDSNAYQEIAIIDSGEQKIWPADFMMNKHLWNQINMETAFLTCLGCIHYDDVFGNSHKTIFCWKYEQFTGFHPDPNPERNYRT